MKPFFPEIFVKDQILEDIVSTNYDLAIFASGYEQRCSQCAEALDFSRIKKCLVLGFEDEVIKESRRINDDIFRAKTGSDPVIAGSNFVQILCNVIFESVSECFSRGQKAKLLIDYSSMYREWYGYALSLACELVSSGGEIEIDFVYSAGVYPENYRRALEEIVLESIAPLMGMEGLSASRSSSVAILGLGFSPVAGLGALERLQPDKVFCFLASPASYDRYVLVSRDSNECLTRRSSAVIELPLLSLSGAYRGLVELTWPYVDRHHINILPMGPKPHILASMLVAKTFRSVACLYGRIKTPYGIDVVADGRFGISKVMIGGAKVSDDRENSLNTGI
ncbi:hypothetical protein [Aromatoleum diolicum]|uniref:Uncharacterized protein n=1 Tax=Aromatoleum diolicum TaxID=75796 RepID=A0ABX1QC22_9RHOO|nr:hypothetical protein [Aromatoleum diolicum]NMG75951.1 hypothetical protein [Aromatoleum diolicum]